MEKNPIIGNAAQEQVENPVLIKYQLARYMRAKSFAASKKAHLEDLMQRASARRWDASKKAKMVRRLVASNQALEQADSVIDQLQHRLSQITSK